MSGKTEGRPTTPPDTLFAHSGRGFVAPGVTLQRSRIGGKEYVHMGNHIFGDRHYSGGSRLWQTFRHGRLGGQSGLRRRSHRVHHQSCYGLQGIITHSGPSRATAIFSGRRSRVRPAGTPHIRPKSDPGCPLSKKRANPNGKSPKMKVPAKFTPDRPPVFSTKKRPRRKTDCRRPERGRTRHTRAAAPKTEEE